MKKLFILMLFTQYSSCKDEVPVETIKNLLPENPVILESGAHFGEDTVWMSELWSKGVIHSFEPLPVSFEKLKSAAVDCKNVKLYQYALSSKPGKMPFYVADGASSLIRPTQHINDAYFHADLNNPAYVDVITLDSWAKENNVSKIDFMWLDMEGNELEALKGATEIFKTVNLVYIEVNMQAFWENIPLYHDVKRWFEEQGFTEIWKEIHPGWRGNALFYRK